MQIYELKNTLTKNKHITLHLLKIFSYKGITIIVRATGLSAGAIGLFGSN